ncbi:MAG: hypothetical protein EON48_08385 [Acetobacteraceae bacterium]|nr:MAG: hypothetical protein EON48_08385 [Acetobacteraceae bacterium]
MASIETLRPGAPGPASQVAAPAPADQSPPVSAGPEPLRLDHFLADPAADRLTGLVAFALAAERQADAAPETIARLRRDAEVALTDHAFRTLHNNVERLQQEAVLARLGHLPRPPGLLRLVSANLVALALAAAGAGWLALHPQTLAGITGLLAG